MDRLSALLLVISSTVASWTPTLCNRVYFKSRKNSSVCRKKVKVGRRILICLGTRKNASPRFNKKTKLTVKSPSSNNLLGKRLAKPLQRSKSGQSSNESINVSEWVIEIVFPIFCSSMSFRNGSLVNWIDENSDRLRRGSSGKGLG